MKRIALTPSSEEVMLLIEKDHRFKSIIDQVGDITLHMDYNYYQALVSTIIAQQLSGKVAQVIEKRVYQFFDNDITTTKIRLAEEVDLRGLGLSYPKIKYLKSLAQCIEEGIISFDQIDDLPDEDVINMLIKVKGIGVWTAQMFLIFAMGRMDVFSSLDLGLRNGVKKLYQNELLTKEEIEEISLMWSPVRTVASLYLWRLID